MEIEKKKYVRMRLFIYTDVKIIKNIAQYLHYTYFKEAIE